MEVDVRIFILICFYISPALSQAVLCSYMTAIPREPRPIFDPVSTEGGWNVRPLVPAEERDDVCMDLHLPGSGLNFRGTQGIYMDEEIEGDVPIAKINYDGSSQPFIDQNFLSGSFHNLLPVIRRDDNDATWTLFITQRQDYELPDMQNYVFRVGVGEEMPILVNLHIVNIDDNPPIINLFSACPIPELADPHLTDCVYEVTDIDGAISTRVMRFQIDSERNDDQIFYMEGSNIRNNERTMDMTVGINQALDFEQNVLHVFTVTALDSADNNHTVTLMIQVQNVEHRPPRWVEIFAVQQFDEKTYQNFTVRAIDGDTGIDKPIYYRLEKDEEDTFFRIETIPGGRDGAIFYVDYIDRDALERDLFQLQIIAYKYDNESFATPANIAIIVNDINDSKPKPLHDEYFYEMEEETAMTLDLEEFGFHDADLGPHAQYTVHLESVSPIGAERAFYISPTVGYQRQTFVMGTTNHSMLDFEETEFQNITLKVVAIDMNRTDFIGEAMLYINLINWNDELPIFEQDTLTVTFNETEGEGFYVGTVLAKDRDIDDIVVHSLMGNIDFLRIDEDTGEIYVVRNDSFDYHRQNEIFVQVRADDTLGEPYNTATSQLIIQLLDINNTPPTLRLPRGSPNVEENREVGEEITDEIIATDPDTTAHLEFEIHWNSSYATKQGRMTDPREYVGCLEIETIYPFDHTRTAHGRLVVREVREGVTIDFEMFEVLYLTVRVIDHNTEIGDDYDESTFTITIVDLNDNPPVWADGTLEQSFRVREMSPTGTVIGSILATDIDGPLYNQVRYTIYPQDDTPEDLVMIDFVTGQITVKTGGAIDADYPETWYLNYDVIASDKCSVEYPEECPPDDHYFNTTGSISIFIIDTNNRVPEADYGLFDTTVYIYENATTGDDVTYIYAKDLDRDEIYHTVSFQINYGDNTALRNFFAVDRSSGRLFVEYTTDAVLDRDRGVPEHNIFFNLIDNFLAEGDGNRNQNSTQITVVLLDVNDNAPELPDPSELSWSISENLFKDMSLIPIIHAPDIDEPGTDNSLVGFEILDLTIQDRNIEVPTFLDIRSIDTDKGELFTLKDLRGYWGTYDIHINAFDHGIPQMSMSKVYELVVRPYNYHAPVFVFPRPSAVLRLSKEFAMANNILVTLDGSILERVHATDEDGLEAGVVTFEVIGDDVASEFFSINNDGDNFGSLSIQRPITEDHQHFEVTIRATDAGTEPGSSHTDITFRIAFIPITGNPIFEQPTDTVGFMEHEPGLEESHQLPNATDPKNYLCDDDCHDIFYSIVEGNNGGHFSLNPTTNKLSLLRELDRNTTAVHTLLIVASNSLDAVSPLPGSTLTVTVNVREADPRPVFERDLYTAGISVLDSINRELLTVRATHSDGEPITYSIDDTSMVGDPSLEAVLDSPFILNAQTGVLTLNIQPITSMQGMFEFQVLATDPAGGYDTADVRIYLITSQNRVIFRFFNTLQEVEGNIDFIADTLTTGFGMTCNIDQVVPATGDFGIAIENLTEVRSHFIRDNQPVAADDIELLRNDIILLRQIHLMLSEQELNLSDFVTELSPDVGTDQSQITIYVLAALSAIMTFLLIVMLITFVIRTRTLNRRLEALSMTKYSSVDSGLNRIGFAAPGTNKHAIEGSNPIWNEAIKAPDFDAISDISNDSSLIGIEDLPQFRSDYFAPADTTSDDAIVDRSLPNHSNHFGFKSTPFSPDFANELNRRNL